MPNPTAHDRIRELKQLFENDKCTGKLYCYTLPAAGVYPHQWLWDSCFNAVILSHWDDSRAKQELSSVVAKQIQSGPDKGMLPHMNYWDNKADNLWTYTDRSNITQPPLVAVAAKLVYENSKEKDISWLSEIYQKIALYHDWFDRRRDRDRDGLVSIIHPWESGWDASPRWDEALGIDHPTLEELKKARVRLAFKLQEQEYDLMSIENENGFAVEPIDFNAIRAADLEALSQIANILGRANEAEGWRLKAHKTQLAVEHEISVYHSTDLIGKQSKASLEPNLAFALALFGGCVNKELANSLVAVLQNKIFWTNHPLSTTPIDDEHFLATAYWRGNVWINLNWLIWKGLQRYGFDILADELSKATVKLVVEHGLWEYYNPITGKGLGAPGQSWSGLFIDMIR